MKKKRARKKSSAVGFFDRILASLFESIEENTEDVLEKLGDIAFVKSTLRKYSIFMVFVAVALIMFVYGIGLIFHDYFPNISLGIIYAGLGILVYLIGIIYRSSK